jgi:uncharacterized membrane protein YeiH
MPSEEVLPNLASNAPLWLALLTVGVNALVGALRGYSDDSRHWDIVGVSVFALLMGLGGGFIRDMLLGNLPAASLRDPWSLATVLVAIGIVLVVGRHLAKAARVMSFLDGLALGLFAVTGTEYGLAFDLPYVSAILLGAITAVGGGMLVSVLQGQTPEILLAGAPTALLAVTGSVTYAVVSLWSPSIASVAGIAVVVAGKYASRRLDIRTRPTGVRPAQ